jgi:hypothetical protein
MKDLLIECISDTMTLAIIGGIYIASAAGPCGTIDRWLGFCGI